MADPLPDLSAMSEIDRLRWLVAHMEPTPITLAARNGLRWLCPECSGSGKMATGRTVTRRLRPGEPGYVRPVGWDDYDPSQYREVSVLTGCTMRRGVGRLDHEPRRVRVTSERWG